MCGINGIAYSSRRSVDVDRTALVRMRDIMQHRGPDEAGLYIEGPIGLAHRRLSIVDVSTGQQPMSYGNGVLQIVFNGEIYNHNELRPDLAAKGHIFKTHSDTETILHLYHEYGNNCVQHMRGMFAFAIWNREAKELFVARDRLGVKPLYYVHDSDGSLFFASEIKALLAANAVRPELNEAVLPEYLANRATFGDSTLFKSIRRLPAGHTLLWKDGKIRIERYWDINGIRAQTDRHLTAGEYVSQWRELFEESVRLRLMADVPLGMFLSGGIDSSAIAAVMSRMVPDPIKTFSVAFNVAEANELDYARMVSRSYKTDHHEVLVDSKDFIAALPHLIWHEDEPIAHSASIPLYFVSKLAQRYVKVVLTGEGSDELLAGYSRYRTTLLNQRLGEIYYRLSTNHMRSAMQWIATTVSPASVRRKLIRTFLWREPGIESIYFDNFAVFPLAMQNELFTAKMKAKLVERNPYTGMQSYYNANQNETLLQRMLYTDIKTYLHELLMKQDQMSMAASIESRVPFLDHKLVEYSAAMPDHLKLKGWTTKFVLREAMKDMLPAKILNRRKMGFPVPLGRWFRGELGQLIDQYILGDRLAERSYFNRDYLNRIVAEHRSGAANHADRLWTLLNFEIWHRHFIDGEPITGSLPDIQESPNTA